MVMSSLRKRFRTSGENMGALDRDMTIGWRSWLAQTGSRMTVEKAFTLPPFYRAVVLMASIIAAMPVKVYRETSTGVDMIKDEATRYLWLQPNPEMDVETFWETVLGHEILGNAYIFVVKNRLGQPMELWPIEPHRVRVGRYDGRKYYQVDNDIPMIDFKQGGEMVHVFGFSRDGLMGLDVVELASQALSLGLAAEEYAARWFGQDGTPRGLLTTDKELTLEQTRALAEQWNSQNGLSEAHRARVLSNGAKFQQISIDPEKSQLRETRSYSAVQVAQLFGIPPHLLGEVERSTSWGTGILEQNRTFLQFTLAPHILRFERAINSALLDKGATNRYMKFETAGFLRPDEYHRTQVWSQQLAAGVVTPNEVRRAEDRDPLPPEYGDLPMWALQQKAGGQQGPKVTDDEASPASERAYLPPEPPKAPSLNGNGVH